VGWLRRRRKGRGPVGGGSADGPSKADVAAAVAHLRNFVQTRAGVEMYVEPRTSVTPTTIVLIATTGEWTRRRVSGPEAAGDLARDLAVPVYDVQQTGYPSRMRAWTSQQRKAQRKPD
jgi:hypothetical protein